VDGIAREVEAVQWGTTSASVACEDETQEINTCGWFMEGKRRDFFQNEPPDADQTS
jgi:hypothetical protein